MARQECLPKRLNTRTARKPLQSVSNNDVQSAKDRIISLRKAARIALETAKKADNFALDLKAKTEKIQIPQLDKNNILQSAEDINESANVSSATQLKNMKL